MALESMIAAACKTDEERYRVVNPTGTYSQEHVGGIEVEVDPAEQGRASRWLRRERPRGWRTLIAALGLPEGGPLTAWPDDPADPDTAVCLAEAAADQEAVEAWLEAQRAAELAALAPEPVARVPRPRASPRPDWVWQDFAACSGESLQTFFGAGADRQAEREARERKAKAICGGCPVRNECLDYAMSVPEKYGTWGGLNEDERASERRRRMRRALSAGARAEPAATDDKQCSLCRKVLPPAAFYRDSTSADGLSYGCRGCRQKRAEAKQEAVA